MVDILAELNPLQIQAVKHTGGPLLVKAGPGTGKTRTLTHRIAYLVREQGAAPESILAITFTRRAAQELQERLEALLERDQVGKCFIGTFHALGFEILRRETEAIGFEGCPVIYDEEDQRALLREVLREIKGEGGRIAVDRVRAAMETLLNGGGDIEGSEEDFQLDEVHYLYCRKKREEGAVDFNDLILLPLKLFKEQPERLATYGEKYRHLFIDEYQDVNGLQVELIRLLGQGAESIMAIGDPDQSIYSFRGSEVKNFLDFPEAFPGATVLNLSDNYRSSVTIVDASSQVIEQNRERLAAAEPGRSRGVQGVLLDQRAFSSDRAEAAFVAKRIQQLTGGMGRYGLEDTFSEDRDEELPLFAFNDIAVLYRLNVQARELGRALEKAGVPFQQVGTGHGSADPLERLLLAAVRQKRNPASRALHRIMESYREGKAHLKEAAAALEYYETSADESPFHGVAKVLSRYLPGEAESLTEAAARLSRRITGEEHEIESFLGGAPLAIREDPFDAKSEKVTLSTLHAAKGLEFPVVFIAGLEEGIMPFIRDDEEQRAAALEEERRLLYVGMTRAESELYLIRARKRFLFGKRLEGKPSPFLKDISDDLIRFVREAAKPKKEKKKEDGQMKLF
ncbi:MAG: ATP-dependent helicase [Planctomycetota bacterium]|jgi:DNA helicase-2/ATP-dependent DNA helicase PcrA